MPLSQSEGRNRALARIHRLCCLGLGGEMLMPDLLQEVARLIPSQHWAFEWAGPNGNVVNHCSSFPPHLVELYLRHFAETKQETDLKASFQGDSRSRQLLKPVWHLDEMLRVDRTTFTRSEYYNVLWRPVEILEQLILRVREAGEKLGTLYLYRAPGELPFGSDEIRMLESIAGFVAHGLTFATLGEDDLAESEDRALFVAGSEGRVLHATTEAQRLLMMALMPRWSPTANWRSLRDPLPEIADLCQRLRATANGANWRQPPVLSLRTPWGEFVLRAYWFGPTDGTERTREIGVTIQRRVPRALAMRRRIESLPLTAREKHLCLLLARDPSRHDLAAAMGVAPSTAVTHQRSVYAKLNVHSRVDLLQALNRVDFL